MKRVSELVTSDFSPMPELEKLEQVKKCFRVHAKTVIFCVFVKVILCFTSTIPLLSQSDTGFVQYVKSVKSKSYFGMSVGLINPGVGGSIEYVATDVLYPFIFGVEVFGGYGSRTEPWTSICGWSGISANIIAGINLFEWQGVEDGWHVVSSKTKGNIVTETGYFTHPMCMRRLNLYVNSMFAPTYGLDVDERTGFILLSKVANAIASISSGEKYFGNDELPNGIIYLNPVIEYQSYYQDEKLITYLIGSVINQPTSKFGWYIGMNIRTWMKSSLLYNVVVGAHNFSGERSGNDSGGLLFRVQIGLLF